MTSEVFKVRVVSVDQQSGYATLVDTNENKTIPHELFIPAYFGGWTNPWPKAGEELLIRYNQSAQRSRPITSAWRPAESATEYEAPAASFL